MPLTAEGPGTACAGPQALEPAGAARETCTGQLLMEPGHGRLSTRFLGIGGVKSWRLPPTGMIKLP